MLGIFYWALSFLAVAAVSSHSKHLTQLRFSQGLPYLYGRTFFDSKRWTMNETQIPPQFRWPLFFLFSCYRNILHPRSARMCKEKSSVGRWVSWLVLPSWWNYSFSGFSYFVVTLILHRLSWLSSFPGHCLPSSKYTASTILAKQANGRSVNELR